MSKDIHQSKKNTFNFFLLGSNGLLGSKMKEILPKKQTATLAKKNSDFNFNVKNFNRLEKIFLNYKFKYVINCIGITDVDKCEKNSKLCIKINADLLKLLNNLSIKYGFKLIQISTDHLYKGQPGKLNRENDKILPLNMYSYSKLLSENYVKKNKKNLIIRTNFTGFRKNVSKTFVGQIYIAGLKKRKINLFTDIYTSTLDVTTCAKLIKKLILKNARGIYNCGTSHSISKSDFALYFAKKNKINLNYQLCLSNNKKVRRPKFLGLNVMKIEKKLNTKMILPFKAIDNLTKNLPRLK